MDVVTSVENAFGNCDDVRSVEVARGKVTRIIRRALSSSVGQNVALVERAALRGLTARGRISPPTIFEGNATVLIDRDE